MKSAFWLGFLLALIVSLPIENPMLFLKLLKESVLFAINALVVNKLRSILSLLGITIGIFAIISVFTVLDALEKNLRDSITSLGDNVVFIQKWPWEFGGDYAWWKYLNRPEPSIKEMDDIMRQCQSAQAITYMVSLRRTVQQENNSIEGVEVMVVSQDYDKVKSFEIANGRYFSEAESASGKNIAIIGDAVANALFGPIDPIGKYIKVFGRKIMVIGIFKKEGESILGGNIDTQVLIPVNFARNVVDLNSEFLQPSLLINAKPGISNEQLKDELVSVMRSIRKLKPLADDNFALNEISILSRGFDSIFDVIGTVGWIIGGFSILVGGFGIANIMFVSVKERTALIGIQKSLGAKNYFILFQFLAESVILSLIGGVIGLIIIYILTFFTEDLFGMQASLTKSNVILGLTISALIGIISGFIPSYSASQLDPVEAIRAK